MICSQGDFQVFQLILTYFSIDVTKCLSQTLMKFFENRFVAMLHQVII